MRNDPAYSIIQKLGGCGTLAATLGVGRQAVWKWTQPKTKLGGTGGIIPQRHHVAILEAAQANEVAITAADFLPRDWKGAQS